MEQLSHLFQKLVAATRRYPSHGLEEHICETVAGSELYQDAWVGETDGTQPTFDACYGTGVPEEYLQLVEKQQLPEIDDGVVKHALRAGRVRAATGPLVSTGSKTPTRARRQ